jgi:hypothetical protein
MNFKLDTGTIITLVAIFIFYLRIMQLRGRKKRLEREAYIANVSHKKNKSKTMKTEQIRKDPNTPPFIVTSWWLVALALVLMCVGLLFRNLTGIPAIYQEYWWIGTTLGALVFAFCFTV